MKANLNNAISHLESLGINVDLFYSIRTDVDSTTFQGHYQAIIGRTLIENYFEHYIDKNGSLQFRKFVDTQNIKVVFY